MYTVLIVDDEPVILQGIRKTFNWEALGFEVQWSTTSSENALDLIYRHHPDVVVTDIRMPKINGIELMRMARNKNVNSEFIVVSGFAEFEYAKEAINLGAFAYFLKPLQRDEANEVLGRLAIHIENKMDGRDIRMLEDISSGGINVKNLFSADRFDNVYENFQFIMTLSKDSRQNISQIIPHQSANVISIKLGINKQLFLVNCVQDITIDLQCSYCSCGLENNASIGISRATSNPDEAPGLIREAEIAVNGRFVYGNHSIYKYVKNSNSLKELFGNAYAAIAGGKFTEFNILLSSLTSFFRSNNLNIENAADFWNNTVSAINQKHVDKSELVDMRFMGYEQMASRFVDVESMGKYIIDVVSLLNDASSVQIDDRSVKKSIVEMLEYIENNYLKQEISLSEIAGKLHLNAAYCCILFKKEINKTFMEYITDLRIKKASELLRDTSLSVDDVSFRSGYADYYYFNRVFKKKTGLTPSQYRKSIDNASSI